MMEYTPIILVVLLTSISLSQSSPGRDMLLDFLKGQEYELTPPPHQDNAVALGQLLRKFLEENFRQIYYELYLLNGTLSNVNSTLSKMAVDTSSRYSSLESNLTDFSITMSNLTDSLRNISSEIETFKQTVVADMKKQAKNVDRLLKTSYSIAVRVAEMYQISVRRKSCSDLLNLGDSESGVHSISPQRANESPPVEVYCDMETDGGGWTVIQRRGVGNLSRNRRPDFSRNWMEYEQGFGSADEDYWIGLETIRDLTRNCVHELLINLTDWEDQNRFAHYDKFHIGSKLDLYRLYVEGHSGNVDDSLLYHNKKAFSTIDEDNDDNRNPINPNCSKMIGGGWWFGDCLKSNLNGHYPDDGSGGRVDKLKGIRWNSWTGMKQSLKRTEMKIRPIANCV